MRKCIVFRKNIAICPCMEGRCTTQWRIQDFPQVGRQLSGGGTPTYEFSKFSQKLLETRLHSSRMHTARLLTVSPSMHWAGGGVSLPGGSALPEGGLLAGGSALQGGVLLVRGVPACRGGGVCLPGGMVSQHALKQRPPPPPWTEFLTHATENITLPQTSFAGGN